MDTNTPVDVQPNVHVGNTDLEQKETPKVEPDLLTRVSQFKKDSESTVKIPTADNLEESFDYKEIENIKDPVAKEIFWKAYKNMQRTVTKKTTEIAEKQQLLSQKLQEQTNWSPERIQTELLNNPQFLQAAQQVAGTRQPNPPNSGLTNDEYSALNDREKSEFIGLKSKIQILEQSNLQAQRQQQHAQMQQKYADYNPVEIDQIFNDLQTGRIQATPEHLYWAFKGPEIAKASYEFAKSEKQQLNQERLNGATTPTTSAMDSTGMPVRDKADTDTAWFSKLAQFRIAQRRK